MAHVTIERSPVVGEVNGYPEFVLLDNRVETLDDLLAAVAEMDLLWRLEAIEAVNDILDEIM